MSQKSLTTTELSYSVHIYIGQWEYSRTNCTKIWVMSLFYCLIHWNCWLSRILIFANIFSKIIRIHWKPMFRNATFGTTSCPILISFLLPPLPPSEPRYKWLVHISAASSSVNFACVLSLRTQFHQHFSHFSCRIIQIWKCKRFKFHSNLRVKYDEYYFKISNICRRSQLLTDSHVMERTITASLTSRSGNVALSIRLNSALPVSPSH